MKPTGSTKNSSRRAPGALEEVRRGGELGGHEQEERDGAGDQPQQRGLHPVPALVEGVADDGAAGGGEQRRGDQHREVPCRPRLCRPRQRDSPEPEEEQDDRDRQAHDRPPRLPPLALPVELLLRRLPLLLVNQALHQRPRGRLVPVRRHRGDVLLSGVVADPVQCLPDLPGVPTEVCDRHERDPERERDQAGDERRPAPADEQDALRVDQRAVVGDPPVVAAVRLYVEELAVVPSLREVGGGPTVRRADLDGALLGLAGAHIAAHDARLDEPLAGRVHDEAQARAGQLPPELHTGLPGQLEVVQRGIVGPLRVDAADDRDQRTFHRHLPCRPPIPITPVVDRSPPWADW